MRNFDGSRRAAPPAQSAIPPGCLPFLLAAVAYLILGSFNRATLGQPVWILIAIVAVPALAGFALGRRGDSRARAAFGALFWAMAFYTLVNLTRIRLRIGSGDTGGNLLAILLVTAAQSVAAGGVAALAATLRAGLRPKVVQE